MQIMHPTDLGPVAMGVIVTLLLMSIYSVGVACERWWTYRRARKQSRTWAAEVGRLLEQKKLKEAYEASRDRRFPHSHLAQVVGAGLETWLSCRERGLLDENPEAAVEATRRTLQHASEAALGDFRRGLATLATIGSTAPFVGLFGTTFGIINAFAAIGVTGSGGIGAISAGISEALVTTAFGLFVAIPAVWAYNFFLARVEALGSELDRSTFRLLDHLARAA